MDYEKRASTTGWDSRRWPNFSRREMACNHCGEVYYWPEFMDRLQLARNFAKLPFRIHSAHRCSLHNARVGGAPLSQHLRLAVDIGLGGHAPETLFHHCQAAGFTGFGFYTNFLHIDLGPKRSWHSNAEAKKIWQIY